jgi:predicted nucleic acid-binding Zn finger protein
VRANERKQKQVPLRNQLELGPNDKMTIMELNKSANVIVGKNVDRLLSGCCCFCLTRIAVPRGHTRCRHLLPADHLRPDARMRQARLVLLRASLSGDESKHDHGHSPSFARRSAARRRRQQQKQQQLQVSPARSPVIWSPSGASISNRSDQVEREGTVCLVEQKRQNVKLGAIPERPGDRQVSKQASRQASAAGRVRYEDAEQRAPATTTRHNKQEAQRTRSRLKWAAELVETSGPQ